MKNNKGITLIALVVTIIVLLILAGVSIAMLTGQNGILNRASQSSVDTQIGAAKDKCALLASDKLAEYMQGIYVGDGVNVPGDSTTTKKTAYNSDDLDAFVKTAINTNSIDVSGITASWDQTDSKKLTLAYKDGSSVVGNLNDGKITWEAITHATK